MSNNNRADVINNTASFFGISVKDATEMVRKCDQRNAELKKKGEKIQQREREGKYIPCITR